MGSHPNGEAPVQSRGTNSHASKAKQASVSRKKYDDANVRFQVAKYFVEELDESYRGAKPYIRQAMKDGVLPGDPDDPPSYSSIRRWSEDYREIQAEGRSPGVVDFVAESSGGRNRKPMDPWVENWLHNEVTQGGIGSIPRLHRAAVAEANRNGWQPPSRWKVRQYVEEFPLEDLAAARHGRRAALVDAMPSFTIPTDRPHEIWMLDETKAPVYIRTLDPRKKEWVPVKPWIILTIDLHSRAIISYWVVDPYKYGADGSYRSREVLGTLLAAALPELAPEVTEPFSGFLPDALRWDNHPTHQPLREPLETYGITVGKAVSRMPSRHGRIEKLHGTVKGLCETIVGADHVYRPVHSETMSENPKATRSRQAAQKDRIHKRSPIHVDDLLKIAEFREAFGEQVAAYNGQEHSFLNGMSPEVAYLRGLNEAETRIGWDALLLMENKVLTCSKAGIDHTEAGHRVRFAAESAGIEFSVGENVEVFCDPLQRRLFVDYDDRFMALMPVDEWARHADPEEFVRRRRREAAEASDYADEVRRQALDRQAGAGASERAEAAMEEDVEDDGWEDGLPPRREGLVAHKRAKARKRRREQAERERSPGPSNVPEIGQDGRTKRRRGMASDPMDEVRLKEEAS